MEITANGIRHHVQVLGEGPRVAVFLHGLVMDNLSSWYFAAAARVATKSRVILYDLRGHGRTERPASGYDTPTLVADLGALLDALDVQTPVHLVGNSFGGQLALAFALTRPDRVGSLALVDAHLGRPGWSDGMVATLSLRGEKAERAIATHFADWLGRHSERKRNRLADTARALVFDTTLLDDLRRSPAVDDAALAGLRMPILALYGEQSDLVEEGRRLERIGADVRWFPGATHSLLWERTEAVASALEDWLAGPVGALRTTAFRAPISARR